MRLRQGRKVGRTLYVQSGAEPMIMARITDPPIAIRYKMWSGELLIIPWHAIRTYSVR